MAFKTMYPDEMVQISGGWLDPNNEGHATLMTVPVLASMAPLIQTAHQDIYALAQPPAAARLSEIIVEATDTDYRHDAIIRGTIGSLTGMAELFGGDPGTELIALRDELIPDGAQSQLKTYRAEATQAKKLDEKLTPAMRARTDGILIGHGASAKRLTAFLEEWISLGKRLGELEDEKGRLEAELTEATSGAATLNARNQWVRVANAMVDNATLFKVDVKKMGIIFGPLWNAEKKADERARQAAVKGRAKPAEEKSDEEKAAEKAAVEKAAAEKAAAEKAAADAVKPTPA